MVLSVQDVTENEGRRTDWEERWQGTEWGKTDVCRCTHLFRGLQGGEELSKGTRTEMEDAVVSVTGSKILAEPASLSGSKCSIKGLFYRRSAHESTSEKQPVGLQGLKQRAVFLSQGDSNLQRHLATLETCLVVSAEGVLLAVSG